MNSKTESNSISQVDRKETSLDRTSTGSAPDCQPNATPRSGTPPKHIITNKSGEKLDLSKIGYAERRRDARRSKPGAVAFDDLGNAQYQWKDDQMLEEGTEGESRRMRALSLANLVLVDDEPPPDLKTITTNAKGLRVGYNPYESGKLEKKEWKKKRDLHALSQWIETRKKVSDDED